MVKYGVDLLKIFEFYYHVKYSNLDVSIQNGKIFFLISKFLDYITCNHNYLLSLELQTLNCAVDSNILNI